MYSILHIVSDNSSYDLHFLSKNYDLKNTHFQNYKLDTKTDVILLDSGLSLEDSCQIAKQIKNISDIPIIFLRTKIDDKSIEDILINGDDYLLESFSKIDFFHKIKLHIKLYESNFKLKEEKLFNESIMESSSNLLFIQDNYGIIKANNVFLDFFHISNIEEFNQRHKCISEVFMEYENFYAKYILNHDENWLDRLSHDKQSSEYKILIMDMSTFEPRAFQIHVTALKNSDKFLVTLLDITKVTIKSKKFEIQATYDNLTKVYNRTKFNEVIEQKYHVWKTTEAPLSFAIFDIDFFKQVNDVHGHVIGDETLITFAQTINNSIRDIDVFARWGGEEFTLLLPNTNAEEAYTIAEELRILIENIEFKAIGKKTCSIGITQFRDKDCINDVIVRSDDALYEAKETGRNRVCIR